MIGLHNLGNTMKTEEKRFNAKVCGGEIVKTQKQD